jgi:hypothetical protein
MIKVLVKKKLNVKLKRINQRVKLKNINKQLYLISNSLNSFFLFLNDPIQYLAKVDASIG